MVPGQGTLQGIALALGKADRPVKHILYKDPSLGFPSPSIPPSHGTVPWQHPAGRASCRASPQP